MRGIILEKTDDYMVVLDENGQFRKVDDTGDSDIGMEISFKIPSKTKISLRLKVLRIVAASILVMGIGTGVYSYSQPYSYVNIDINPSIEITANIFNRIISAQGFNAEGKEILIESQFRHKPIEQGVSRIIETATDMGYISQTRENAVLLTVFSGDKNHSGKLEDRIIDTVADNVQEKTTDVEVEILVEKAEITEHVVEEGVDISPGKKLFVEKILKEEPNTDIEDLASASVGEIIRSIKNKEDKDNADKDKNGKEPKGLAHGYYTLGKSNRGNRENNNSNKKTYEEDTEKIAAGELNKNNNTKIDKKRTDVEKSKQEYDKDEDMTKKNSKKSDSRENNSKNSEKGKDKKLEKNNKQGTENKQEKDSKKGKSNTQDKGNREDKNSKQDKENKSNKKSQPNNNNSNNRKSDNSSKTNNKTNNKTNKTNNSNNRSKTTNQNNRKSK